MRVRTALIVVFALVVALLPMMATVAGAATGDPEQVTFTLEGCRNDGDPAISLPDGDGKFICPDAAYTTGNLGKGWNELDLVPHRVTLRNGTGAQTYTFVVAGDYVNNAGTAVGWDVISPLTKNAALSDASCPAVTSGAMTITPSGSGVGGADQTIYRMVTIDQPAGATCVYDYYQRLALGAHLFSGSSLQSNLWNQSLTSSGIGQKRIQLPVNEILPQELSKTMNATRNADHMWNLTKSATPVTYDFGQVCSTATAGASTSVSVTLTWTKLAANPTGYALVTNIYATNPAARTITISVSDAIRSGTTVLDTANFGPVNVPANTAGHLVGTHSVNVAASAVGSPPNFNDVATATYTDLVTGVAVPGNTTATASVANDAIGVGTTTNAMATISDTETITGDGLTFSVATPSSGSFSGYTAGTPTTGPVSWNSGTVSSSGSVTFAKTVYLDQPRVTTGTLSDSATLAGSDGASASASASTTFSSSALVSLTIDKSIPNVLDTGESQTFTFKVKKASDDSVAATASITFGAGETTKSATVTGLAPGIYYVSEDLATGWAPQPDSTPVDLSVGAGGIVTCSGSVSFANSFGPASAKAVKTTTPAGSEIGWTMCLVGPGAPMGGECVQTATVEGTPGVALFTTALEDDGSYTITEQLQANWWQKASTGDCSFTVSYPADFDRVFSCSFSNERFGRIIIAKETFPDGASQTFPFALSGGPSALAASFNLSDGGQYDTGYMVKAGSGYVAAETVPAGWDLTSAVCDDGSLVSNISVSAGETVTCTFTNTQRGDAEVMKSVSGMTPPAGTTFSFEVRTGASPTETGTVVLSDTTDAAGNADFGGTKLQPGTYQLCETGMLPGWHSSLSDVPGSFVPNSDDPVHSNDVVCVIFVLDPGESEVFNVDNMPPPGGDARTIGYWKNWSSCSGGKQADVLGDTLGSFPIAMGQTTHGVYIGNRYVDTCEEAVAILNKSTLSGKKMAGDAAYGLAAQLLATRLNIQAGAAPLCIVPTANAAQALLVASGFNGTGQYLGSKVTGAALTARTMALGYASLLDDYNNNELMC